MKRILIACLAGALFFASCSDSKKDGDKSEPVSETKTPGDSKEAWVPIDSAMMDKMWKENMTISDNHKMLASWDGTWSGEVTMWMADGAPPMTSKSTTVNKMVFGGLYQESAHTGDMMGMPFNGKATMGYDNMKKEFFSTWIDNMGSGILYMTGQWDAATKKLNLSGTMKCGNGHDATMREVFTIVDDTHQTLEMYGPDPATGKEFKNMEIRYTKK